jgi:hypothetical protein
VWYDGRKAPTSTVRKPKTSFLDLKREPNEAAVICYTLPTSII